MTASGEESVWAAPAINERGELNRQFRSKLSVLIGRLWPIGSVDGPLEALPTEPGLTVSASRRPAGLAQCGHTPSVVPRGLACPDGPRLSARYHEVPSGSGGLDSIVTVPAATAACRALNQRAEDELASLQCQCPPPSALAVGTSAEARSVGPLAAGRWFALAMRWV